MKRVHCDDWRNGRDVGITIENPSWDEVKLLIQDFNGETKTLVTFGDYDEGYYMAIGGGCSQYILYLSFDDEGRILELIDPNGSDKGFVELVVGGQAGRFSENMCVSQERIIIAAKTFYETQTPDSRLYWRE